MRYIVLLAVLVVMGFMVACDDHDVLPVYKAPTIFSASTTLTRVKDTLLSAGDTIKLNASGTIADTSRKYAIAAAVKATDTTTAANLLVGTFIKSIAVKFDTVGMAKSGLFRWSTSSPILLFTPFLPAGTKIKTSAVFTYGLNLSSQTGNNTGTDGTKFAYVK